MHQIKSEDIFFPEKDAIPAKGSRPIYTVPCLVMCKRVMHRLFETQIKTKILKEDIDGDIPEFDPSVLGLMEDVANHDQGISQPECKFHAWYLNFIFNSIHLEAQDHSHACHICKDASLVSGARVFPTSILTGLRLDSVKNPVFKEKKYFCAMVAVSCSANVIFQSMELFNAFLIQASRRLRPFLTPEGESYSEDALFSAISKLLIAVNLPKGKNQTLYIDDVISIIDMRSLGYFSMEQSIGYTTALAKHSYSVQAVISFLGDNPGAVDDFAEIMKDVNWHQSNKLSLLTQVRSGTRKQDSILSTETRTATKRRLKQEKKDRKKRLRNEKKNSNK